MIERFLAAIESIAASLELMSRQTAVSVRHEGAPTARGLNIPGDSEFEGQPPRYEDMDRSVLTELCSQRGIDIPKGTKTPTLVKWLKTDDEVTKVRAVAEPEPVAEEPVAEEPVAEEPVAEEPVAEEVDPFASATETAAPEEVTKDMVLAALQVIQKDKGNAGVVELLVTHGGVSRFKDLPEDKYSAVYKAAA